MQFLLVLQHKLRCPLKTATKAKILVFGARGGGIEGSRTTGLAVLTKIMKYMCSNVSVCSRLSQFMVHSPAVKKEDICVFWKCTLTAAIRAIGV